MAQEINDGLPGEPNRPMLPVGTLAGRPKGLRAEMQVVGSRSRHGDRSAKDEIVLGLLIPQGADVPAQTTRDQRT